VIPPDTLLTLEQGRLQLESPMPPPGHRMPIDAFLKSLAEDQGAYAAGVILSGTGSDGTMGLRAIKENGGLTIAQAEPAEAKAAGFHRGMPDSAVATGLVDFVLAAEEIPAKIEDYGAHLHKIVRRKGKEGLRQEVERQLQKICAIILSRKGHDFRRYKPNTLVRRVLRRLQVQRMISIADYMDLLRRDGGEVDALFNDMLIGVTHFFRDPEAFQVLEQQVLPRIINQTADGGAVRVWVPGCSTGEEAYSIAILLREQMDVMERPPKVQVFATDIDETAIETARAGRYPKSIAADIPSDRLQRFFDRDHDYYRLTKAVRELCVFAYHDLLKDPPFSRLDLISCRNVMIYLDSDLQKRLLPVFHYTLNDEGFLFLGPSETVSQHSDLFRTVDKTHRLYQKRAEIARTIPGSSPAPSDKRPAAHCGTPSVMQSRTEQQDLMKLAQHRVLEHHALPFVLVNRQNHPLLFSGDTGKYLSQPSGAPTSNVVDMARRGLKLELRGALHRAASTGERVEKPGVSVVSNDGLRTICVIVEPIFADGASGYLILFQAEADSESSRAATSAPSGEDARVDALETELRSTKDALQSTVEELESSNAELQSCNEELLSMNEELQSSNEELETSKEEKQAVNQELEAKVEELSRSNSDLKNLLESIQTATVILDRGLRIRWFNAAATGVFRMIEGDRRRGITDLAARLDYEGLAEDAEKVLSQPCTIEREVDSRDDGGHYIMRLSPYRTVDEVIEGVVMVLVDITQRKQPSGV
jgi:two-component system CheB/CheR fusion protein